MSSISIKLTNIGKKYMVSHQKPMLIKNILGKSKTEEFWALKNIDLKIKKGEKVGIIGPNGAGKTTLLKIIAGISTPSSGEVRTYGKVVSLVHLTAGFHPDFSGKENIFLNGMLAGMSRKEIKKKYKKIVEFADIGEFIDAPFYAYSDGMKFRLAFSIAMASKCDILLMDEVFVSGDVDFQQKTLFAIKDFHRKSNITTIVCSHIPAFVWLLSDVFYELDKGRMRKKPAGEISKLLKNQARQWRKEIEPRPNR